jgi:catechol 2,3-dioxygenase-like lactoylglutathione lyase family enzyme
MAIEVRAHHMSFPVSDLERSRRFYEGVLGLRQIPRPDFGIPGIWYQAGACEVHLIQVPADFDAGTPPRGLNPAGRHSAFAVGNYDATVAHLKEHGLEVLETSRQQGQMWVKDPDGHVIELIVAP